MERALSWDATKTTATSRAALERRNNAFAVRLQEQSIHSLADSVSVADPVMERDEAMGKPAKTMALNNRQDQIRERALIICEGEHAAWVSREHWDRASFELELEEMKREEMKRTGSEQIGTRQRSGRPQ